MAPTNATHARSHSLLLLQKLLNLRDGASPLTLLLDNLEQPAQPLVSEFISRAQVGKSKVIFLSFATLRKPQHVDVFIKGAGRDLQTVRKEVLSHVPALDAGAVRTKSSERVVLIVDSLNALASSTSESLAIFLSSILTPVVSLVAVYHTDVPTILPKTHSEYEPHPFTVLCHLATAILRLSSLRQEIERQKARNRSIEEPEWGLKEDREGVIVGLRQKRKGDPPRENIVINMELRRRSGRTVSEKFIFTPPPTQTPQSAGAAAAPRTETGKIQLLSDHEVFIAPTAVNEAGEEEAEPESTFNLGLTDKQRKDREGIVLPYFDAQTDIGAGEGGRILYDMGEEDDFDDEEDEI